MRTLGRCVLAFLFLFVLLARLALAEDIKAEQCSVIVPISSRYFVVEWMTRGPNGKVVSGRGSAHLAEPHTFGTVTTQNTVLKLTISDPDNVVTFDADNGTMPKRVCVMLKEAPAVNPPLDSTTF